MAEDFPPEFRETDRSPSFVRPIDTTTRDALRRSRVSDLSHPSISASTRSWVYSTQQNPPAAPPPEPIPVPSPVPSPVHTARPLPPAPVALHTTNPDVVSAADGSGEEEYMNINADVSGLAMGYQVGKPGGAKNKTFVGGFVTGLKRLPRAVLRYGGYGGERRRHVGRKATFGTDGTATDGTGMTGNTLPKYASNPSTPVAGPSTTHGRLMHVSHPPEENLPPSLQPAGGRRRHHTPSFFVSPPSEEIQGEIAYQENTSRMPPRPLTEEQQAYEQAIQTAEVTTIPLPSSPRPTRTEVTDHGTLHYSLSQHPTNHNGPNVATVDNDEPHHNHPPSVLAHPLPTQDYRRMSKHIFSSSSSSTNSNSNSSPSFSTELNPVQRFFSTLYYMPWIATDRVTVDYRPGLNTSAWGWRRASRAIDKGTSINHDLELGQRDSGAHPSRSNYIDGKPLRESIFGARKGKMVYRPVEKPLASWYTHVVSTTASGLGRASSSKPGTRVTSWAGAGLARDDVVDLLSSGTGTRSSVGTGLSAMSPRPRSPASPASPRVKAANARRRARHAYRASLSMSPPPPPNASSPAARSPGDIRVPPRAHRPHRHTSRVDRGIPPAPRHHHHQETPTRTWRTRRRASSIPTEIPVPMTPPMYPHGYAPAQPPYISSILPSPPPPHAVPMYVLQTPPPPGVGSVPSNNGGGSNPNNTPNAGSDNADPNHSNHSQQQHPQVPGAFPFLSPVYMQMMPGPPSSVVLQSAPGSAAGGEGNQGSPPGFAGRGAGYPPQLYGGYQGYSTGGAGGYGFGYQGYGYDPASRPPGTAQGS